MGRASQGNDGYRAKWLANYKMLLTCQTSKKVAKLPLEKARKKLGLTAIAIHAHTHTHIYIYFFHIIILLCVPFIIL